MKMLSINWIERKEKGISWKAQRDLPASIETDSLSFTRSVVFGIVGVVFGAVVIVGTDGAKNMKCYSIFSNSFSFSDFVVKSAINFSFCLTYLVDVDKQDDIRCLDSVLPGLPSNIHWLFEF